MVAQLEIGLHQFLEHHHRVVVPLLEALKKVFHKHSILLVRSVWTQNHVAVRLMRSPSTVLSYILVRKGRLS